MLVLGIRQCRVVLTLIIVFACSAQAKVYNRCELALELHFTHGIPLNQVATWVCIAQRESLFNTAAVGRLNADGSSDHGLFQISDNFWCSHNDNEYKSCGLLCSDLLDNDISDDVACIKEIHEEHTHRTGDGFDAWTTYQLFCGNQDYKDVATCFQGKQPTQGFRPQGSINSIHDTNLLHKKYQNNPFLKNVPVQKTQLSTQPQGYASSPKAQYVQSEFTKIVKGPNVQSINGAMSNKLEDNPFLKIALPHKSQIQSPRYNDIPGTSLFKNSAVHSPKSKIYTRCSLAKELYTKHRLPLQDIATWVCIAEYQSSLNTAAVGRQNSDGSANYGLFQISNRYWCSDDMAEDGGKACRVACNKLIDDDLTDDVRCVRTIYDEHTRISGDGFNAWTVYQSRCQNHNIEHIRECFDETDLNGIQVPLSEIVPSKGRGKIYESCELAQELYHKHNIPLEQVATWVCIAHHESNFKTAAVGRLNTDGSADHGLFQISDLYWCTHDLHGGKACNIPCERLLDSDITDDVRCIQIIYDEHTRISGDGFNAWTVYQPHCLNKGMDNVKQCFTDKELKEYGTKSFTSSPINTVTPHTAVSIKKGKIYSKCELAKELYHRHQMPMGQIPIWVCIAEHESSYNTAAIGRLNTDGSADHGLFQISDLFWCTHDQYGGKACNTPCDKLLDSDISDDVKCIKVIYEEHTRISGDGFTAWTVYKPHCRNKGMEHVKQCFSEKELKEFGTKSSSSQSSNSIHPHTEVSTKKGKIYSKCELAKELHHKHRMPMEQIPTWVCIAQHESSYNTAAVGRLNIDGSTDHGLFQISDLFWCTHDQYGGKACNMPCDKLLDSDISDDIKCIKVIYEEHTRISGDGFTAWTVYKPHCRNKGIDHVKQCFSEKELMEYGNKSSTSQSSNSIHPHTEISTMKGKIYSKCELAKELHHKHRMPMEQIPTWVCIAEHESSYNTAAVGRLNIDGSADHGLFQISDLFWCTHDQYGGKACNMPCDKLLDSDISDDVRCIKIIYDEHTRISGDGFTAWTVYKPHCRNQSMDHVKQCFSEKELKEFHTKTVTLISSNAVQPLAAAKPSKGKIYKKCELAHELLVRHQMPMQQIPTWVCIAQHESSYNTGAVGRLNTDGSADHGLFQISDLFWCTHDQYGGKACNIPCDKLLDSDISDDVRCIKIIYEEHTQLSGDGFNAWTVYKPHCRNRKLKEIRDCFGSNEVELYEKNNLNNVIPETKELNEYRPNSPSSKYSTSRYANNPFLQNANKIQTTNQHAEVKVSTVTDFVSFNPFLNGVIKTSSILENSMPYTPNTNNYKNNPFLNGTIKTSGTGKYSQDTDKPNYNKNPFLSGSIHLETSKHYTPNTNNYKNNPFLNGTIKTSVTGQYSQVTDKSNYNKNPFLSGSIKASSYNENPYLSSTPQITPSPNKQIIKVSPTMSSVFHKSNPFLENKSQTSNKYLDSNSFRTKITTAAKSTTTTLKPKTTSHTSVSNKPTATISTTTNYKTTVSRPTSQKLTVESTTTAATPRTTLHTTAANKPSATVTPTTNYRTTTYSTTKTSLTTPSVKGTTPKTLSTLWTTQVTKTTATKRPTIPWNQENEKLKQSSTPTTAKSTTTKSPTTKSPTTKRLTTKNPREKYQTTIRNPISATSTTTTQKPTTSKTPKAATTIKYPTTIWSYNANKTKQISTTTKMKTTVPPSKSTTSRTAATKTPIKFMSTTKSSKTTTTGSWSWVNEELKQKSSTTTKKPATSRTTPKSPATSWTTTRKPITTTKFITTSNPKNLKNFVTKASIITTNQSSQKGQQYKQTPSTPTRRPTTTLRPATEKTTTSKPQLPTTKVKTSWSWNNAKQHQSSTTTTQKPQTASIRTQTTKATTTFPATTRHPLQIHVTNTKATKLPTIARNSGWQYQKHLVSTTKPSHLQISTGTSSELKISTTKLPQTQQTATNRKATIAAWNWQQPIYANLTATTKSTTEQRTTSWQSKTTTPRTALFTERQHLRASSTTHTPQTTTLSWLSGKIIATAKPMPSNSWNVWQGRSNNKVTTTKSPSTKAASTTTTSKIQLKPNVAQIKTTKTTNEQHKATTKYPLVLANYKKDPFSHPFFDKVRHQFEN